MSLTFNLLQEETKEKEKEKQNSKQQLELVILERIIKKEN